MTAKKILCLLPVNSEEVNLFHTICPADYSILFLDREPDEEELRDAEIILGRVSPKRLSAVSSLRWIQLQSAGIDGFESADILPSGAILTNSSGAYGPAISEHMLAMLLSLQKRILSYWDSQKEGKWKPEGAVTGIEGSTCLVIGMGDIGGCFARKMHALGAIVYGIRRTLGNCPEWADEIIPLSDLDAVLPKADIVALSLPSTPQTFHVINQDRIQKMKSSAIVINVGRGTAIDTEALLSALQNREIGGACLDVTDPEPLPENHPLFFAPNTLITPHVSGGYHWEGTRKRIVELALENLNRYIQGKELLNQVDFASGYRKSVR